MANHSFVVEAVMLASYGQLVLPRKSVHYFIPYTTILELYEMEQSSEPIMADPDDNEHVKQKIQELIAFFELELNRKKIEQALAVPWKKSAPIRVNDNVALTVVYAVENAQFGDDFDPVETELLLTAMREEAPLLTDQIDFIDRAIEAEVPVQLIDIDDFEFALEDEE